MSTETDNPQAADKGPDPTRVRYLSPDMCRVHLGTHGALHVTVTNDRIYGGVFAAYAFPVAYPTGYISLIHSAGDDKEQIEIGIIRSLDAFPPEQADLIRSALKRRYFVHTILRIIHIGWKYGFVALDVQTDKGPASFLMNWSHDRAVDYGRRGKILIDVDDDRYLVPDLDTLTTKERAEFTRYIYW
jgi:ATP-binding cassette, subfamily B, bacterial